MRSNNTYTYVLRFSHATSFGAADLTFPRQAAKLIKAMQDVIDEEITVDTCEIVTVEVHEDTIGCVGLLKQHMEREGVEL